MLYKHKCHIRRNFAKSKNILPPPFLLGLQKKSFDVFLQANTPPDKRQKSGIQEIFTSAFPIEAYQAPYVIEYKQYSIDCPYYTISDCKKDYRVYGAPFKVLLSLKKEGQEIDNTWIDCGELPLMTDSGVFIVNGQAKVIISSFFKSTGVFFECLYRKRKKSTYVARIIPAFGPTVTIELSSEEPDKKEKKYPLTALCKVFGFSESEITTELKKKQFLIKTGSTTLKVNTESSFKKIFFDPEDKYSIGTDGRFNINIKLGLDIALDIKTLTKEDILAIVKRLLDLRDGKADPDDKDHLANKSLQTPIKLIRTKYSSAIFRLKNILQKRLNKLVEEIRKCKEQKDINFETLLDKKTVDKIQKTQNAFRRIFYNKRTCQFFEQYNPLTEISHKRRMTAIGYESANKHNIPDIIKQLHATHYGRICPVETPEKKKTGLAISLGSHATINERGAILVPYQKVTGGRVTDDIEYLSAFDEQNQIIANATEPLAPDGIFLNRIVIAHHKGALVRVQPEKVEFIDVAPSQIMGISASLIPFIEHNDPTRALMAANMQRQALPLLKPTAPLIGTGLEKHVAIDSQATIIAKRDGIIFKADAQHIVVQPGKKITAHRIKTKADVYVLSKYQRTNQNTCVNQRPIVKVGDLVKTGDILADGHAIDSGELALGRNLLVAFMPWRGYNFEDGILISESVVRKGYFASIHIKELSVIVRQFPEGLKKGIIKAEKVTNEIPLVRKEILRHLYGNDEDEKEYNNIRGIDPKIKRKGIVKIGSRVEPGDVLVGKIDEREDKKIFTPEQKILRVATRQPKEFDDTSLKVPQVLEGTVIDVQIQDEDLPDHIYEIVTVKIATQKNLSVGAKMTGRHGNKGVVSKIVPEGDMPFLEDGTPVDIVLNSMGVITRMNLGQIFETHLGWAAKTLGDKINNLIEKRASADKLKKLLNDIYSEEEFVGYLNTASEKEIFSTAKHLADGIPIKSPAFDGATEEEIDQYLELAGLPLNGKAVLYDGMTGEPFAQNVTVGIMYMMRLHHLAEEKMHARSVGRYDTATEIPKKGQSNFGGQRMGEMEAWALYGHGAAHALRESLTIKADDVKGREKLFKNIVFDKTIAKPVINESFRNLIKELQGLCLKVFYTTDEINTGNEPNWTPFGERIALSTDRLTALKISLASPETIIDEWSHGEINNEKIIDYRGEEKYKTDGLFSRQIFGPTKNYRCACRIRTKKKHNQKKRYKGDVCEICHIEKTEARVRRERMGDIKLGVPVVHVWFLPKLKDLLEALYDINQETTENIIYYNASVVSQR